MKIALNLTYTLVVTDPYGNTNSDNVTVQIDNINVAPEIVNISDDLSLEVDHDGDPNTTTAEFCLSVFASDFDGDELSFNWNCSWGQMYDEAQFCEELPAGYYTCYVEIDDHAYQSCQESGHEGLVTSEIINININEEFNLDPFAVAGPDQENTVAH